MTGSVVKMEPHPFLYESLSEIEFQYHAHSAIHPLEFYAPQLYMSDSPFVGKEQQANSSLYLFSDARQLSSTPGKLHIDTH